MGPQACAEGRRMRVADVELVLGGARSGKSSYALELAKTHEIGRAHV